MSATTVMCPNGHRNQADQKFCGQCGVGLAGMCPNGHQNPLGQRYCGQCGAGLPESSSTRTPSSRVYLDVDPEPEVPQPAPHEVASEKNPPSKADSDATPAPSQTQRAAEPGTFAGWYNSRRIRDQIWICAALFLPIAFLYMLQDLVIDPALDRAGQHVANGFVTVLYGLYFVAVIAWVARDRDKKRQALVVAGIFVFLDVVFSWPITLDFPASFWMFSAIVVGYVAAWALARRQDRSWLWGLAAAAVICTAYRFFVTSTDLTGWMAGLARYEFVFLIGCLTCWAFDAGNRLSEAHKRR